MRNQCTIDDCGKPVHGHGMCTMHYLRWYTHGDPRHTRPNVTACEIDACTKRPRSRTTPLCEMHYYRIRRNGDARLLLDTRKPDAQYRAAHSRIERDRGKARSHQCVGCHAIAAHWSYDHTDPDERTSSSGQPYSLSSDHYSPRCYSCHMVFDGVGANQYTRR